MKSGEEEEGGDGGGEKGGRLSIFLAAAGKRAGTGAGGWGEETAIAHSNLHKV